MASTGGNQITCSTTYSTAGNTIYYTHWTTSSYSVTWDMGGGKTESTNQEYGEKLILPSSKSAWDGYTFAGWFTAENGSTEVTKGTNYTTTGATTYYAQFTSNCYSITWALGSGNTKTKEQLYGEKLILPNEPSKDGYSFLGSFTEKENGTRINADTIYATTSAGQYYAHWIQVVKFSVTVPVELPLVVSENGKIHAVTGQVIRNSFERKKITILHSVEQEEVNRHHRVRVVGQIERLPPYCASDWNYIRFDCAGRCYEMFNGDLRQFN